MPDYGDCGMMLKANQQVPGVEERQIRRPAAWAASAKPLAIGTLPMGVADTAET